MRFLEGHAPIKTIMVLKPYHLVSINFLEKEETIKKWEKGICVLKTSKWREAASIMNQFGNVLAGPIWGIVSGLVGAGLGVVPFAVWSNCADYALPYNKTISG